jgi:hypothetical protein
VTAGSRPNNADGQIKLVQGQGSRAEVERWNPILTAENPTFNVKPNEFLMEMAKGRKPGTAVDVGMGQGRNRAMTDILQRALRPGGVLVIEAFHRDATKGRSMGGGVVFDTGQLPALYPQLRVVRYEEPMGIGDFGQQKVRLVRYCGERPE